MTGSLHHVELYVSDLAAAQRFYALVLGTLGYVEFQKWEGGISYVLGDTYIVLVQTPARFLDPPYHRRRVGLNHLAFHAGTPRDVDVLTRRLIDSGYTLLYPERHPHAGGAECYAAFFEDPDRIKVELVGD